MAGNSLRGGLGSSRDDVVTVTVSGDDQRTRASGKPAVLGRMSPREMNTLTDGDDDTDEFHPTTPEPKSEEPMAPKPTPAPKPRRTRVRTDAATLLSTYLAYAQHTCDNSETTLSPQEWAAKNAPYADPDVVTEFAAKVRDELADPPAPPPGTVLPGRSTGDPVTDASVYSLKARATAVARVVIICVMGLIALSFAVVGMPALYLLGGVVFVVAFFGLPLQTTIAKGMYAVITVRTWVKTAYYLGNLGLLLGGTAAAIAGLPVMESSVVAFCGLVLLVAALAVERVVDSFAADIKKAADQTVVLEMITTRTTSA